MITYLHNLPKQDVYLYNGTPGTDTICYAHIPAEFSGGGAVRCVYLSSIRFSSIIENWKLKSISVHPDWFHLKQNVKKKNQNWNKHFWSFHLRKIAFKGLTFYFLLFSSETQNKKLLSFFAFLTFHLNQTWKLHP